MMMMMTRTMAMVELFVKRENYRQGDQKQLSQISCDPCPPILAHRGSPYHDDDDEDCDCGDICEQGTV